MNLEIFSCSGGMARGFADAGVPFDMVVDWNEDACASYEANLGRAPIRMDVRDLLRLARLGWRPAEAIELFVADPPCTPWSRAGKRRGVADPRDCLVITVELIRLLRPHCYLIGNVPGLQDSTSWPVVQRVIGGLHADGYCVADYASLDAADYGVPQHRVRPFWFGHLDGPCLTWLAATHGPPTRQKAIPGAELKPWVTCRQALRRLPVEQLGRPVRLRPKFGNGKYWSEPDAPAGVVLSHETARGGHWLATHEDHNLSHPDEPAKTLTRNTHGDGSIVVVPRGGGGLKTNRKHRPNTPDEPSMTVTCKGDGRGAQGACVLALDEAPPRRKRPPSTKGKQWERVGQLDAPAATVLSDTDAMKHSSPKLPWPWDRPATTAHRPRRLSQAGHHETGTGASSQHGPNAIILSEKAAAILQGFPRGWKFVGKTKKARWSQIGMAMPPPLARAVATSIVAARGAAVLRKPVVEPPAPAPEAPPQLRAFKPELPGVT